MINEYLEFEEFDDKFYSTGEDESTEEDEYSILGSMGKAVKGEGKYKAVITMTPEERREYKKKSALGKAKDIYKYHRSQDGQNKKAKKDTEAENKRKANIQGLLKANQEIKASKKSKEKAKEDRIKDEKKAAVNAAKEVKARQNRPDNIKKGAATLVGAGVGAATGNLLSRKWKKELAGLKVKPNRSPSDEARIKSLKRKIAAATGAGALVGGTAGFMAGRQLVKKKD